MSADSSPKNATLIESEPSLGDDESPASGRRNLTENGGTSAPDDAGAPCISPEELRSLLGTPEVQALIRQVVSSRLGRAPQHLVQDVAQEANLRMLGASALPRSLDAAAGWVVTVTRRTVADHLRGKRPDAKWLDPDAEVEQQPGDASDEEFPGDGRLLGKWLQWAVRNDDADREILAMLLHKARTEKTYQELATEYFTTVPALKSRVHAFKEKYAPRWRRVKATLEILLLLLGAVVVAIVAWLLLRQRPAEIQPDPAPPVPSIAPTTTASAKEPVFEPARPTAPAVPRRNVPEKP